MSSFHICLISILQFLGWYFNQIVEGQVLPPIVDSFCIACNNSCDYGPNFHRWVLEDTLLAPDNFLQLGMTINGQYPGPTISVGQNQHLVVQVENRLDHGVTIHWHGLHQARTLAADGAGNVTQGDIPPNGTYTYCMYIGEEAGTHMYHGHTGFDIIWIHGALIVRDPNPPLWARTKDRHKYFYHEERILLLEQLFHDPIEQFSRFLMDINVERPVTQSLLINGKSYGDWADNNNTAEAEGYSVLKVTRGKTYRLRLINLSSELMFRFEIQHHSMVVIEMDGIYTVPVKVDHVDINTGQRYSVLITMDRPIGNYVIKITENPGPGPLNGLAILHYAEAMNPTTFRTMSSPGASTPIETDRWVISQLRPNPLLKQCRVYPVPERIDREIVITFHAIFNEAGLPRFALNDHIFEEPAIPYIDQVRNGGNITDNLQVFEIFQGQSIQIISQARAFGPNGICGAHPYHYHGRYFYVAATGRDEYNPEIDGPLIDAKVRESGGRLEFRDVFTQYRNSTNATLAEGEACGWAAIRFIANNNGMWLTHCHITSHMIMGKTFVIWEHDELNPMLLGE